MRKVLALALAVLACPFSFGQNISTVAGGGPNNLPATQANLNTSSLVPPWVAVDSAGNLYVSVNNANRVFKVNPAGVLTLAAGSGASGFSGDGGPATAAMLSSPKGIAVDGSGNLYIAERFGCRIRKVNSAGIINTVAGNGTCGNFTGGGGPATSASFGEPSGVAVDLAGNLYFSMGVEVLKVNTSGIISKVAGTGTQGYNGDGFAAVFADLNFPNGLATDSAGNLYIADTQNARIRRVTPAGIISTVVGANPFAVPCCFSGDGGLATNARLSRPFGVAVDGAGNIYVSDTDNQRIRKVNAAGVINTVAGNGISGFSGDGGPGTLATMSSPIGVAVSPAGDVYFADSDNRRVRKVSTGGIIITFAGNGEQRYSGNGSPAVDASLSSPRSATSDALGNIYVADSSNSRIRKVQALTGVITTIAGDGQFGFNGDGILASAARLSVPGSLVLDSGGNIFFADQSNRRVRRIDAMTGLISTVAGNGTFGFSGDNGPATVAAFRSPSGIALDSGGNLFIADQSDHRIRRVDAATGIITTIAGNGISGAAGDGGPAAAAQLSNPSAVIVDGTGNLFIADTSNSRLRRVDAVSGLISTVAGSISGFTGDGGPATAARLSFPAGLALDSAGNIFVSDQSNRRIRRIDRVTGIITTVVGNGTFGFSGDGGSATAASLSFPGHLSLDSSGNLIFADVNNDRIRRVNGLGASDSTPPLISHAVSGPLGNNNWYVDNVTLTWTVTDPESAITTTGCGASSVTSDTAGVTFTCSATSAGGTANQSVTIKLDKTPPSASCTASDGQWHATDISLACSADGSISGLANSGDANFSLSTNVPINTETANASTDSRTIFDNAGNSVTIGPIAGNKVDKKAPEISSSATAGLNPYNSGAWTNQDVTVSFACTDNGSGVVSTSPAQTFSAEGAGQSANGSCTDAVGNSVNASFTGINIDKTAPTIAGTRTPAANGSGWNNSDVTVSFSCSDVLSGIASCTPPQIVSGEGAAQSRAGTAIDQAGNSAQATVTGISIDKTAPTLNASVSPNPVLLNGTATASSGAQDALSGLALQSCGAVNTGTVGAKSVTCTASDKAGNNASQTIGYSVRYAFVGFFQPIDNLPVINTATGGRTIPVKWQLKDANGALVSAIGSFVSLFSAPIACGAAPADVVEEQLTVVGDALPKWTGSEFHFNWQTTKGWTGCRLLQLNLADGTQQYAKFSFK